MFQTVDPTSVLCSCLPNSPCFWHNMKPKPKVPAKRAVRRKVPTPPKAADSPVLPQLVKPDHSDDEQDLETIREYYKMPGLISPISSPAKEKEKVSTRSVDSGNYSENSPVEFNGAPAPPRPEVRKRPRTPAKENQLEQSKRAKYHHQSSIVPKRPNHYIQKFGKIVSFEQREEYVKAYNAEFKEYMHLYGIVSMRSPTFERLETDMKRERIGSRRYNEIANYVLMEYKKHQEMYTRFHYLEAKLSHIKSLITDYDENHNVQLQENLVKLYGKN